MSSRAASARKRIANAQELKEKKEKKEREKEREKEKRPPSSKGFFSRSKKSSRAGVDQSYPSPPVANVPLPQIPPNRASPAPRPADLPSEYQQRPTNGTRLHGSQYTPPSVLLQTVSPPQRSAHPAQHRYPSPPHEEHYSGHVVHLNPPPVSTMRVESLSGTGEAFIEASYQPPPPPRVNVQRASPSLSGKSPVSPATTVTSPLPFETIVSFPPPPSYPPPVPVSIHSSPASHFAFPSPSNSPRNSPQYHSSLLLQSASREQSPTPSELPTYSNSGSPHISPQLNRPPLQLSIQNSPLSAAAQYQQLNNVSMYPTPPASTVPPRHTPSPLQVSSIEHLPPAILNDSERRPWARNFSGNRGTPTGSASSSPRIPFQQLRTDSPRLRPPPSIASRSSGPSGRRSPVSELETPPPPTANFVFPGSRATGRPKVSSKTGTPQIKLKVRGKSKRRGSLDDDSKSASTSSSGPRPPTPDMPSIPSVLSSPLPSSLASPVSNSSGSSNGYDGSRGGVRPAQSQTFSETASAFSDDSADLSLRRAKSSTSSNPDGTPAPFVFPSSRSRAAPNKPASFKMKSLAGRRSRKSSNASGDADSVDERKRFMGILLKKKKKQLKEIDPSTPSADSGFSSGDNDSPSHSGTGSVLDTSEGSTRYEENQEVLHAQSRERARRIKSRIGSYPLDPYDSVLLDNDRHTGELLTRLNPMGSPTFHNYGNSPPTSVLDLGCGQGHWVIDAAIAWRGYGTKVTGYDMVDISKGLLPWAIEQGVTDSIRFVRGNFLKQRLPFSDNSFDLVRMSCLALSITSDSWIFVLQEVCRVLMIGGRLELIDDLIFFPYGKSFSAIDNMPSTTSPVESVAPRLDITIPSSAFTTFSIYDGDTTNPGLGFIEEPPDQDEFYELYGVEEEGEDDTATINGDNIRPHAEQSSGPRATPRPNAPTPSDSVLSKRSWERAHATSKDLEALFDHMLMHKFGIQKDPNDFIVGLMKEVFGHAREVKTMHLTLAPPDNSGDDEDAARSNGHERSGTPRSGHRFGTSTVSRRLSMGLAQAGGLVLWPSTFIPMDHFEIEIHASKHLRMLLSCKNLLLEHAIEATDDEEIDEESVMEALWEYESFLRHRFNPPPPSPPPSEPTDPILVDDTASIRGSIAESVCSDNQEAMWEIQSEFRQRFAWSLERSASRDRPSTPSTPKAQDDTNIPIAARGGGGAPSSSAPATGSGPGSGSGSRTATPSNANSTAQQAPAHGRTHSAVIMSPASSTPVYSREELTHVRTFRIYEAIKIDDSIFGSAM